MCVKRSNGTVASYIETLAAENKSNKAEILSRGAIPFLMRAIVQETMPNIALRVPSHCLQLFKNALPTDFKLKNATECEAGNCSI